MLGTLAKSSAWLVPAVPSYILSHPSLPSLSGLFLASRPRSRTGERGIAVYPKLWRLTVALKYLHKVEPLSG